MYLVDGKASDISRSVLTTSTLIVGRNPKRIWLGFVNDGAYSVYIRLGEAAVLNTGLCLRSGGSLVIDKNMPWLGEIFGIAATATCSVPGVEVEEL